MEKRGRRETHRETEERTEKQIETNREEEERGRNFQTGANKDNTNMEVTTRT